MTDQEAFEAHMCRTYKDPVAREMAQDMERDTWNAALAWLRSQGEPVAWARSDTVLGWKDHLMNTALMFPSDKGLINPIPLFLAPQPAIPDGWRPIETAPKDELILVGPTKRMGICAAMNHSRDGWGTETPSEWVTIYTPTHWMPLPAAPEPSK